MATVTNRDQVSPRRTERSTIWRLIEHSADGEPLAVGCGVVEYAPLADGEDGVPGHSHENAEFYHVLDGAGIVLDEGKKSQLRPGDSFVIAGGHSHALWATSAKPLRCFYVALLPRSSG